MDSKVFQEALSLAELARKNGASGKVLDIQELKALNEEMRGQIPSWYIELMVKVPLANLEFGWQPDDDAEIQDFIEWSDIGGMRSESIQCYPGLAILDRGYINVGSDSFGGNPYFIPNDRGEDPPIYQIYHDVSDNADEILQSGRREVASSLSRFFRDAFVCSQP